MRTQTILITGASSGIGQALALHYAHDACTLFLMGRDRSRLDAVARECARHGAHVSCGLIDVRNRAAMFDWIQKADDTSPIDKVFANAGVMVGTPINGYLESHEAGYLAIETNMLGVINTVQPLLDSMIRRQNGQVVIISSLAAFIQLPDCPSYCAAKSAVLAYGLSLRAALAEHNIKVSVVCPGYVTTPMMYRETGSKPFKVSPQKAASIIARRTERNPAIIAFPRGYAIATRLHAILPDSVRRWILNRMRFTVISQ